MATPAGITTTNSVSMSEEQAQLLVKVINREAEEAIPVSGPLLDYIKAIFSNESVSISPEMTGERFADLAASGNLSAIIPAGFLLLHRDLVGLSSEEITSGTGTSLTSGGVGSLLSAGLLAAAGLLGAGLISDSLTGLMESLLEETDASELASDEDIKSAVKKGLKSYITVFFLAQSAYLIENVISKLIVDIAAVEGVLGIGSGVSGVFNKIAEGALIVEKTADTVKKVFSLFGGEETLEEQQAELALSIADTVLTQMLSDETSISEVANDDGIKDAVKSGLAAYVKTFFLVQTAQLVAQPVEDLVAKIGAAIVTGGVSLVIDWGVNIVKDLAGLVTGKETVEEKMASLALDLLTKVLDDTTVDTIKNSDEIKDAIKEGLGYYVKGFFTAQAAKLSTVLAPGTAPGAVWAFFQSVAEFPEMLLTSIGRIFRRMFGGQTEQEDLEGRIAQTARTIIHGTLDLIDKGEIDPQQFKDTALLGLHEMVLGYFTAVGEAWGEGAAKYLDANALATQTLSQNTITYMSRVLGKINQAIEEGDFNYESLAKTEVKKFTDTYFSKLADTALSFNTSSIDLSTDETLLSDLKDITREALESIAKASLDTQITAIELGLKESNFNNPVFTVEATTIIGQDSENIESISNTLVSVNSTLTQVQGLLTEIKNNPINITVAAPPQSTTSLGVDTPDY